MNQSTKFQKKSIHFENMDGKHVTNNYIFVLYQCLILAGEPKERKKKHKKMTNFLEFETNVLAKKKKRKKNNNIKQ